jgi:hypothetical protein
MALQGPFSLHGTPRSDEMIQQDVRPPGAFSGVRAPPG